MTLDAFNIWLIIASFLLFLSVIFSKSSSKLGMPILLFFLAVGIIAGGEGVGGLHFENYELTQIFSIFALCLVLFSGGLETDWSKSKDVLKSGISLSTLGIMISTLLIGVFCHMVFNFNLFVGFLLGAIISSTDAAAVFSVLNSKSWGLDQRVKSLVELESGSNDPMAYFLLILFLDVIDGQTTSFFGGVLSFVMSMGVGLICGLFMSWLFLEVNRRLSLDYWGLYPALTLSLLFFTYSLTTLFEGNGFLAVYIFGIILGNKKFLHKKLLLSFFDGISWITQICLFIILGLLVSPTRLMTISGTGFFIALFLIFIARPVSVYISLTFTKFDWKEKLLISWAGLKGAVPIVFACFVAVIRGEDAYIIFDIVFFSVIMSAVLQGMSLRWLAKKLNLDHALEDNPEFPLDFDRLENINNGLREFLITERHDCIDKAIVDLSLPKETLILYVKRNKHFIAPQGGTKFEHGDRILVMTKSKSELEIVEKILFEGPPKSEEDKESDIAAREVSDV